MTKNTSSWYGYIEGAMLAGKINDYYHLIGTCYSNLDTPSITFDIEGLVNPNFTEDGILETFEIKEGRLGQTLGEPFKTPWKNSSFNKIIQ